MGPRGLNPVSWSAQGIPWLSTVDVGTLQGKYGATAPLLKAMTTGMSLYFTEFPRGMLHPVENSEVKLMELEFTTPVSHHSQFSMSGLWGCGH